MFMLKDNQGRAVVAEQERISRKASFWAKKSDTELESVPEATIFRGDDVFLSPEYIRHTFDAAGFDWVKFDIDTSTIYRAIRVDFDSRWEGNSWIHQSNAKRIFMLSCRRVDETTFNTFVKLFNKLSSYTYVFHGTVSAYRMDLDVQTVFEIIGEGKAITPSSLENGYAKGESRIRLAVGDTVEIQDKKSVDTGTILRMAKKATVLRKNGAKSSLEYARMKCTAKSGIGDDVIKTLEPTIKDNLDYVLGQKHRLYRAKTEKRNLTFPMFPEANERQTELTDVQSCTCPLCGWQMAPQSSYYQGIFTCFFCKVQGKVIHQTEDEVTLLMNRWPAKNRFAIKEVRCCTNCGLFAFESGRQGKRSTGYCKTSNQCVQGYNTCNYWFPREPNSYESNMRQHVTNLGYGVNDTRNTERNDIRDTVYRAEDHLKEKSRAEKAKNAYIQAHSKFMAELVKLAQEATLHEATLDEKDVEGWKAALDDGC